MSEKSEAKPVPLSRIGKGAIADRWGVSESFFILGAFMLLLCAPLALIIRRTRRLRSTDEPRAACTTDRTP